MQRVRISEHVVSLTLVQAAGQMKLAVFRLKRRCGACSRWFARPTRPLLVRGYEVGAPPHVRLSRSVTTFGNQISLQRQPELSH